MSDEKGIYLYRCVLTACHHVSTTFAPIERCEVCNGPVTRQEYRPLGSEGEDETIAALAEQVHVGFRDLLWNEKQ